MIIAVVAVAIAGIVVYFTVFRDSENNPKQIQLGQSEQTSPTPKNEGPVSPISGIACENWNRRPIAVTQPSDVQARPAAGFSEADMVIEMPAFTASVTRLMGIYSCNIPVEIGAIRSLRHDNIHLAKGLDAILVHWGYSIFAENLLKRNLIDSIDCGGYCDRREATGAMRLEDTSRLTGDNALKIYSKSGYRTENTSPSGRDVIGSKT